jgi:hypothetical protein
VTQEGAPARFFEFEAFGTAVGLAIVCGGLSVPFPVLDAPTAALAALAVAGWSSLARRRGSRSVRNSPARAVTALAILGAAAVAFLASPPILSPFRGALLAGGLLPLFFVGRTRSPIRPPAYPDA